MSRDLSFVVTGGAGFIGSHLVEALNRRGHENILIVDWLDDPIRQAYLGDLAFREVMDPDEFRARVRRGEQAVPATVFHLGACSSTTELDEAFLEDNNTRTTQELCTWCLQSGSRFVYASSAATYGDGSQGYKDDETTLETLQPLNPYGWSKHRFDLWAREQGVLNRVAGLKYFNVFGPRENHKGDMRSVVHKAFHQIMETGEVRLFKSYRPEWGDGEQTRDFVYVEDAVAQTLFFHDHPDVSGLFNCGTGNARTWLDLARAVFAAMEREANIVFVDMPEGLRERYQYHTQSEMTKARQAGFTHEFASLEAGVAATLRGWLMKA